MKKDISLKQRLVAATLALLMLISSLLGTTFAWFTDSATSGSNVITAGRLDVNMYWSDTLLAVNSSEWKNADGVNLDVFSHQNWEPGYTEVKYIKIANEGSLDLKWQLSLEVEDKIGKLAEVIDVYYVNPATSEVTSLNGLTSAGTFDKVISSHKSTSGILPEEDGQDSVIIAIAMHMQESAGNEYQKESVSGDLGFKLHLVATQYNSESDSFGSDYDKESTFPTGNPTGSASVSLVDKDTNSDGLLDTDVSVTIPGGIVATIPAGTKLAEGATQIDVSVDDMATSSNIMVENGEEVRSLNVHAEGVSEDNTVPAVFTIPKTMPIGLNIGNYRLYHVEDGRANQMNSTATPTDHNDFYYDPATGDMTVAMATYSEVALVADTNAAWEGNVATGFSGGTGTEADPYIIANADQFVYFGDLISNDNDNYGSAYYKLVADINFGGKENVNGGKVFYPVGYHKEGGAIATVDTADAPEYVYFDDAGEDYARSSVNAVETGETVKWYTYGGAFRGTFDGNGNTIKNIHQNTWQLKGNYSGNYWNEAMGVFGYVYGGTVKNLTVDKFTSEGEFTPTGVIAAYAVNSTFENIAITNCNPGVYNTGNGGIVGIGGNSGDPDTYKLTFNNITIDNTNKITALWGSWDVACGGLIGMFRGAGHVYMTNCHVGAQIDVYNDVCGNYQYYWYRYSGMMIGTNKNMITDKDGYTVPETSKFHAKDCTVHFGNWNDYYYCELVANSLASYTHDHQFSRLTEVDSIDVENMNVTVNGKTTAIPTSGRVNYVVVNGKASTENATCYHFVNGEVWEHADAGTEVVSGETVLKEDKQHYYLPFNQLFTGYGWGVKHIPVYNGENYAFEGITILDREVADSVNKFESEVTELSNGKEYKLGDIFTFVDNGVILVPKALTVGITNLDENNPVSATIVYDRDNNWENGTITFTGTGKVKITIQDYYFCTPTTITVDVTERQPEVKFDVVMNNGDFLHRVGNSGTVALDKLFKAKDGVTVGTVSVTVEAVNGTSASGTYSNNAIQFNGTGVVKVTITDNDCCTPTELYLEVVDATNVTGLSGTISGNVVLLNDCGLSSLTVSGRNSVYGNGFTATYSGNGQYLNNGLKQGVITVSENGTLDNLRVKATIYPRAYMYYGSTMLGDYVQGGPSSVEGDKTRYHYQLSAVAASGNATISNCYIYGGRNNIFVNTGDVTIKDTILECGTVANVQIQSNASHTITLENVTTIQHQVNATIDDTSKVMLGAGVIIGPDTTENPTIVLNGNFKQYNWVTESDKDIVTDQVIKTVIETALKEDDYKHTVNGQDSVNLGIIYMNGAEFSVSNNTGLPYEDKTVSVMSASGRVYSVKSATSDQIYSDHENADRTTVNGLYEPQFKYDDDLGGQYIEKTDDGDEFLYREGDTVYVMFPSGDTKEIDLAALVNIAKYTGQNHNLVVTVKDENGNAITVTDGKVSLSAAGRYTATYTVTDTLFYDKDGNSVTDSVDYSWEVTVDVSLKDTAVPDARFEFDATKQKMGYYKPTIGDVKQYLPFLAGLKIYDYNGKTEYLRFDGSSDFNKVASITITGYASNKASIEIKLTDGGIINTQFLARANSGGGSTYTGKIKTSNNTIYFVTDSGTSNKDTTTTAAYWYVDFYKFIGNNGVAIQSGQQTFNSAGSSASTPSGNFSTTIKYTVTYDANSGACGQTTGYATSASAAVTLPTPTRSGYIFAGWYTAASGGTRVGGAGDSYTPASNITLYAQWGKPCTVTYNANGGSCGTASEKYTGTALTLPTPTRDGYWFIGWYDAAEGGNKIGDAGATYNPIGETTLYAHWQEAIKYTVTYNANGGTCGTASATYEGTSLTLPTPTRTGYTFQGWFTAASGGTRVGGAGDGYTPSANITLYVQWKQISYTITISKQENATVTVDKTTAHYNDTISVTVSFSQNNSKTLTVKDESGNTVLSKSAAGTYTFTMPASNVTIEASSSGSCFTPDTLITLADGTQKRIDELTFDDKILAWDFFTGSYVESDISLLVNHGANQYEVIYTKYSDETELKLVGEHGVFDYDLNKFIYITAENATEYIGHRVVKQNLDGGYDIVTLTDAYVQTEYVEAWSITSAGTSNAFASGLLTVAPPEDFYNWIDMDGKLHYDVDQFQKDVETYGLYTYDDFKDYVTYEQFVEWNGAYLKIAVEKGYFTFDYILELIELYKGWMPNN